MRLSSGPIIVVVMTLYYSAATRVRLSVGCDVRVVWVEASRDVSRVVDRADCGGRTLTDIGTSIRVGIATEPDVKGR